MRNWKIRRNVILLFDFFYVKKLFNEEIKKFHKKIKNDGGSTHKNKHKIYKLFFKFSQ